MDIFGRSFYNQAVSNNGTCANCGLTAANILAAFLGSPTAGSTAAHGALTPGILEGTAGTGITNLLQGGQNTQAAANSSRPKAFVNYIFLDEQFKYAGGGASLVGDVNTLKQHFADLQNIAVPKNGYLYVYCSNESNINVFFDNVQVVHTRGALLEETHYYPFGLVIAGISSRAAGRLENKKGLNGKELQSKEFSDGSGLENYDFGARFYDPQIGRWYVCDQLAEKYFHFSPYAYVANNPIKYIDPDGKDIVLGGNMKQAKMDMQNQVPKELRKFVTFSIDKQGKTHVKVDYAGAQKQLNGKTDIGLDKLNKLVADPKKILYEVADKATFKDRNTGKTIAVDVKSAGGEMNAVKSNHPNDGERNNLVPKEGFDAQIVVTSGKIFETDPDKGTTEVKNREAAVFHAIDEVGKIEIDGKDYGKDSQGRDLPDGAHAESKEDEKKFYKRSRNPGVNKFQF